MSGTKKPFADPEYTQVSNDALDYVLPVCSPACWKLLSAIIRKTKGWHKAEDELSYSQLELLTGMARATVAEAIKEALEAGYIERKRAGVSFEYSLNKDFELQTSSEIELVQELNQTSSEIEPIPVQKLNTQKKEIKTERNKAGAPNGAAPEPTHKEPTASQAMFQALADVCGYTDLKQLTQTARGVLNRHEKQLRAAGYTPEFIAQDFRAWWYQHDFRGRKRQKPTPDQVVKTIDTVPRDLAGDYEAGLERRRKEAAAILYGENA